MKTDLTEKYKDAYAVLFGGRGYERDISLLSAGNFIKAAARQGFGIMPVYIDERGAFYIYSGDMNEIGEGFPSEDEALLPTFPMKIADKCGFYTESGIISVRLCVPVLHGDFGEDGKIQGLLASADIPFAGCDTFSGAVSADKAYTKAIAAAAGIPVLKSTVYSEVMGSMEECRLRAEKMLGYPMFIKPARLGSSVGASLVLEAKDFLPALEFALSFSEKVLIEEGITDKRELESAYLSAGGLNIITPPGEAVSEAAFYDYDAKYKSDKTQIHPAADVSEGIKKKLKEYTGTLAAALDVRHMARFDYFLTADGDIYFNEVNTLPGMTGGSLYSAMLASSGIDFPAFVRALLSAGGER